MTFYDDEAQPPLDEPEAPAGDEPVRRKRPASAAPEAEVLLRRVLDLIKSGKPMPMSTTVRLDPQEAIELLEEAIARLPDELRAARWLLKEREEFLAKVRREGDDILEQARTRAERMVQRTEVVKAAEARARQVVEKAEDHARRMRLECEDFCDQKLASFEIVLERTMKMVTAGRTKLQGNPLTGETPVVEAEPTERRPRRPPVFDQDE